MKYSIKVNEVRAKDGSNIKGFATVVFGDIVNIGLHFFHKDVRLYAASCSEV